MLELLRHNRDLRYLFIAQVVSYMGDWFCYVALLGVVGDVTDSSLLVSLVFVSQTLPAFLVSPVAGAAADRFDRRRIVVTVSCVQAVAALEPAGRRAGPGVAGVRGPGHDRRVRRLRPARRRRPPCRTWPAATRS